MQKNKEDQAAKVKEMEECLNNLKLEHENTQSKCNVSRDIDVIPLSFLLMNLNFKDILKHTLSIGFRFNTRPHMNVE